MYAVCAVNEKQFVSGSGSGSGDKTFKLWNVDYSTAVMTYSGHAKDVYVVCMANAKQFVSGSGSGHKTFKL